MSSALLDLALRNASLCGPFDPMAFIDSLGLAEVDEPIRDAVLGDLACCSTERILPGLDGAPLRYCWLLHPDARRRALNGLASKQMIDVALGTAPEPLSGDQLGPSLRAVLRRDLPQEPQRNGEKDGRALLQRQMSHWGSVYDALQFVRDIPSVETAWIDDRIDLAAVKIKELQRECDIQIVLPSVRSNAATRSISLFGRDHFKRRISTHLRGLDDDPRPVLMTAVGGAGKSALLASLIHGWNTNQGGTDVIVLLDFDRRQLVTGEPIQMLQEVLRQLDSGLMHLKFIPQAQLASTRAHLRSLRADMPNLMATGGTRDFGSQLGFLHSSVFPRLGDAAMKPLHDMSIALIMDSFEAVDRQGGVAVRRLMDVEAALRNYGLSGLRTLVSGRAPPLPEPDLTDLFGPEERRIKIEGIGKTSGGRLLKEHDTAGVFRTVAQREAASEALGGHPLALIVLGQYAATRKGDAKALVQEITSDEGFKAEFAKVYLYERILQRIDDPELRAMAHPGLVLRKINADIVRLVLANPCFGGEISRDKAHELMARFAEEYWLTEDGEGAFPIRHRPSLRRLMLPGLFAGPSTHDSDSETARKASLAEKARAVCNIAADFFSKGPPLTDPAYRWWRDMPAADREVEATYYDALGNDITPWFDRDFANHMFLVLGDDLETLPQPWISRAKALRGEMLEDAEWEALPKDTRDIAADAAFRTKIRQDGFELASSTFDIANLSKSTAGGLVESVGSLRSKVSDTEPPDTDWTSGAPFEQEFNIGREHGKAIPELTMPQDLIQHASPETISREIASCFLAADFAAVADLMPAHLEARRDSGSGLPEGDDLFLSPDWYCLLVASLCPGDAPDNRSLPKTNSDHGSFHDLVTAIRSIRDRGSLPTSTPSPTDPFDGPGGALRKILSGVDNRLSAEQFPLRSLRYHGAEVMALLTGSGSDQKRDIRLGTRALALAACNAAPTGDPSDIAGLPGNLPALLGSFYAPEIAVDLALIQSIYRKSEPFHASARELSALSGTGRKVFVRMLRGLSPDLYGPARRVLADLGAEVAIRCVESLAQETANWPRDLLFEKASAYRDVQAATIVETSDQCGVFDQLLGQLAPLDPRAEQLATIHAAIGNWFFPLHGSVTC